MEERKYRYWVYAPGDPTREVGVLKTKHPIRVNGPRFQLGWYRPSVQGAEWSPDITEVAGIFEQAEFGIMECARRGQTWTVLTADPHALAQLRNCPDFLAHRDPLFVNGA